MKAAVEARARARARPSMISAKYRLKEERRKVVKLSLGKLRRIDDPESCLRRSVLLNNCLRRLQRDARADRHPPAPAPTPTPTPTPAGPQEDDCALQEVLSQFYLPPTPRMLTSIDDEGDGGQPPPSKRPRPPEPSAQEVDMTVALHAAGLATRVAAPAPAPTPFWAAGAGSEPGGGDAHLSCGHASLLGGVQAAVYHSLLASLET